jgi:hypothetical protein
MELGRIPEIDLAQVQHNVKISKIENVNDKQKVDPNDQYKKILTPESSENMNEVILDNVQFGFNNQTKDFFVRIKKGEAEYTFPTESMMAIKAHLMDSMKSKQSQ